MVSTQNANRVSTLVPFLQIKIANSAPQLRHLHLRYCKRITDTGINAITHSISNLYSLDLSFCSRITSTSIFNLLECRYDSLSELRLKNCTRLDILAGDDDYRMHDNSNNLSRRGQIGSGANGGTAGRLILNAIRANGSDNCLCLLDVRECGGSPPPVPPQQQPDFYPESDPFVQGMTELQFQQRVPGFFCRRARWNAGVQRRLVDQILHMGRRT